MLPPLIIMNVVMECIYTISNGKVYYTTDCKQFKELILPNVNPLTTITGNNVDCCCVHNETEIFVFFAYDDVAFYHSDCIYSESDVTLHKSNIPDLATITIRSHVTNASEIRSVRCNIEDRGSGCESWLKVTILLENDDVMIWKYFKNTIIKITGFDNVTDVFHTCRHTLIVTSNRQIYSLKNDIAREICWDPAATSEVELMQIEQVYANGRDNIVAKLSNNVTYVLDASVGILSLCFVPALTPIKTPSVELSLARNNLQNLAMFCDKLIIATIFTYFVDIVIISGSEVYISKNNRGSQTNFELNDFCTTNPITLPTNHARFTRTKSARS